MYGIALFWLSDQASAAIGPHLPKNQPGARRVDDRRVISGILHVLKVGYRWRGYRLGDKGYDADRLRRLARDAGAVPAIPGRRNRKRAIRYHKNRYAGRHLIGNAFCRLKDRRRIATRYDKLATNFLSGVGLAPAPAFWLRRSPGPNNPDHPVGAAHRSPFLIGEPN